MHLRYISEAELKATVVEMAEKFGMSLVYSVGR